MPRTEFPTFSIVVPHGWQNVTDTVEVIDAPFTLARDDGVGALQLSIGSYVRGPDPNPSPEDLLELLQSVADSHALGTPQAITLQQFPLRLAAASFSTSDGFMRIWCVSDGHSFAFVTYTCESGQQHAELEECEQIVRGLQFGAT
jgi:hypothetical protein